MPVVLAPVTVIAAGLLAAALVALVFLLFYALRALAEDVPVIGGYIADGLRGARDALVRRANEWARPVASRTGAFFVGIAYTIRNYLEASAELGAELAGRLVWAWEHGIPRLIRTALLPLREALAAVRALARAAHERISALRAWTDARLDALRAWAVEALLRPLRWVITVALPALSARITNLAALFRAVVVEDVLPRLGALELDLRSLARLLERARAELAKLGAYVGPLAAAFTVGALIELLRHVRECRPKTNRLCSLDLDDLEDLLGFLFVGLTLAEIVQIVEESIPVGEELEGIMRELAGR